MTRYIGNGRHRLMISEHPDKVFVASTVGDGVIGGFLTPDQCMEAASELIRIARMIRGRG